MVILWDDGNPALTVSAACVFFSDNQDWVVIGRVNEEQIRLDAAFTSLYSLLPTA